MQIMADDPLLEKEKNAKLNELIKSNLVQELRFNIGIVGLGSVQNKKGTDPSNKRDRPQRKKGPTPATKGTAPNAKRD